MRLNMFQRKKISKWLAAAGLFLCLLLTAVPAYAEEPATAATQTETAAETKTEDAKPADTKPEEQETAEKTDALPGGNLTLVDDVITASDANREFLTVVSKDGSYFYIVIDRDTAGAGNVYFLNLVDNQDLYKLTGEETPEVKEPESIVVPEPEPQKQEAEPATAKPDGSEEEAAKQKQKSLMITVAFFAAVIVGVVIYLLKKRKAKKAAQADYDLSEYEDDENE